MPERDFADTFVAQWDRVATVRGAKRYVVPDGVAPETLYPAVLEPLCFHREVAALGDEARQFILVQACYQFMQEIGRSRGAIRS